jgi:hypothetical protein
MTNYEHTHAEIILCCECGKPIEIPAAEQTLNINKDIHLLFLDAKRHLKADDIESFAQVLGRILEKCQRVTGDLTLGLPRGVDMGGERRYGLQSGALWEFVYDGWSKLMERIIEGRGYALCNYGRCLTLHAPDLGKMSRREAEELS